MLLHIRSFPRRFENYLVSRGHANRRWLGASAIIFACLLFAVNSLTVKKLDGYYSAWLISFIRFSAGVLLIFLALGITGRSARIHDRKVWFLRGFFGALQMTAFFAGVQLTSSGRCTLLNCTYPIFVAIFGHFLFNERINKSHIAVMLSAFTGALLVFYDGSSYPLYGNLLCLSAGIMNGMAMNYVKKAREKHNSFMVYLSPCLIGMIITSFAIPQFSGIRSPGDLGIMVLIGFTAFIGQVCMGFGFKFVKATAGSILGMSEILFSVALSFVFVAEEMPPRFFMGMLLIIAALVFNHLSMRREH